MSAGTELYPPLGLPERVRYLRIQYQERDSWFGIGQVRSFSGSDSRHCLPSSWPVVFGGGVTITPLPPPPFRLQANDINLGEGAQGFDFLDEDPGGGPALNRQAHQAVLNWQPQMATEQTSVQRREG